MVAAKNDFSTQNWYFDTRVVQYNYWFHIGTGFGTIEIFLDLLLVQFVQLNKLQFDIGTDCGTVQIIGNNRKPFNFNKTY